MYMTHKSIHVSMLILHPYARFIIFRLSMIKLMSRVSDEAQHNDILLNTIYIPKKKTYTYEYAHDKNVDEKHLI